MQVLAHETFDGNSTQPELGEHGARAVDPEDDGLSVLRDVLETRRLAGFESAVERPSELVWVLARGGAFAASSAEPNAQQLELSESLQALGPKYQMHAAWALTADPKEVLDSVELYQEKLHAFERAEIAEERRRMAQERAEIHAQMAAARLRIVRQRPRVVRVFSRPTRIMARRAVKPVVAGSDDPAPEPPKRLAHNLAEARAS